MKNNIPMPQFRRIWATSDRAAAAKLCNNIRVKILGLPPYSPAEFDRAWQYTTIFDENYDKARDEFRIMITGLF